MNAIDRTRLNFLRGTDLSAELSRRGLTYLVDGVEYQAASSLSSELLIAGLAQHTDARFHMALIALFLYQPQLETAVSPALSLLDETNQLKLKLFYTAAVLLQVMYAEQLQQHIYLHPLSAYYNESFSLDASDAPEIQLKQLARTHRMLTSMNVNWLGTYYHAAERLLTRLEKEALWMAA